MVQLEEISIYGYPQRKRSIMKYMLDLVDYHPLIAGIIIMLTRQGSVINLCFFTLYDSSDDKVDFYILYAKEGTWGFGLRHLNTSSGSSNG